MTWVCEYCGNEGETDEDIDHVQCDACGELVVQLD